MNQIIIVNKEAGMTSRDVVNKIGKILNTKKVGHNGTLDPIAEGVLVITTNRYTKLNNLLASEEKEYIAEVELGKQTDTLDITGKIEKEKEETLNLELLRKTLKKYEKTYNQEVPKYSAIKVKGKKLYEYARENKEVDLPKKEVTIKKIELISYTQNTFTFKTLVSKGTYIRSLIRDILNDMNQLGTMSKLTRTKQGIFSIENSYTIKQIEKGEYKYLKAKEALSIQQIKVNEKLEALIKNGVQLKGNYPEKVLFLNENDEELAIYKKENETMKVEVMF